LRVLRDKHRSQGLYSAATGTGSFSPSPDLGSALHALRRCRPRAATPSALRYSPRSFLLHLFRHGCSMAKRASFHPRRVSDIPAGPWVPHAAALIASPAWRARSLHVVRLLDRIELEHCAHAGRENGYLTVTYQQFVEWGIGRRLSSRRSTRPFGWVCWSSSRGTIAVVRGGSRAGTV
jgi:hypothetical protein